MNRDTVLVSGTWPSTRRRQQVHLQTTLKAEHHEITLTTVADWPRHEYRVRTARITMHAGMSHSAISQLADSVVRRRNFALHFTQSKELRETEMEREREREKDGRACRVGGVPMLESFVDG